MTTREGEVILLALVERCNCRGEENGVVFTCGIFEGEERGVGHSCCWLHDGLDGLGGGVVVGSDGAEDLDVG